MTIFLTMSLRRSEVVRIRWEHIKTIDSEKCIVIRQKGGSYKTLPIENKVIQFLDAYKQLTQQGNGGLHNQYDFKGYIFTKHNSGIYNDDVIEKHISSNYLYELVKRYCKKLQFNKKITPHSFRKSFIEIALNNNQNLINICNSTGHADTNLIKYYDTRSTIKNNAVRVVMSGLV